MQIVPIKELKDTASIERMCQESKEPVFVTKNGYGKLVVMDIDVYTNLMKKAHEAMLVNEGIKQANNGEVVSADEVFQMVKARYGYEL
ncbi:MAG: type II toxin-antitoxin system Phd/YefM family antitoxin [Bacillota bacterium]